MQVSGKCSKGVSAMKCKKLAKGAYIKYVGGGAGGLIFQKNNL